MKFYTRLTALVFLLILFAITTTHIGLNWFGLPQDFIDMPLGYKKIDVTVIVIGYNRPKSLKRALSMLEQTSIPKEYLNVNLKICLDGSDNATYQVASSHDTKWYNGKFTIFQRGENYGLARHITSCWDHPRSKEWALMVEDDVVVSPQIFDAFADALLVREQVRRGRTAIQGIAMHGQRVNQYCWKGFVHRHNCPAIYSECSTKNATDSILGALMCPETMYATEGVDWIGTQIPSSWGAFYTGHSWKIFQQYYGVWQQLNDAQLTVLGLPLSMSNEWEASWKRPFAELMYAMGWTLLYRNTADQKSLVSTTRDAGVHTKKIASPYEKQNRCLIVLPSENNFTRSTGPVDSMVQLDYCSYPVENLQVLQKRGLTFVQSLVQLYDGNRISPIWPVVKILRDTHSSSQLNKNISVSYTPPHATLDPIAAAGVILVITVHEVNREFRDFCKQMLGQGSVKYIVVGPAPVCIHLRNYEAAHCLPEKQFVGSESHMPIVTKLLQSGLDVAIPNVTQFVGVMNSDIIFQDDSLMKTLTSVKNSDIYMSNCVVVGRRFDFDWTTKEKKLHTVFGMDYFIFNVQGAQYAVKNMPPLVIGRTRWDSYFMGHFVLSPHMEVIDATETLPAIHGMDFSTARLSHTHDDQTNHNLVTEVFRMGRTDHSNYKMIGQGVEVHRTTQDVAAQFAVHQERYKFDLFFEKATNFTYSPSALFPYVTCFCALLENPPKQFCESPTLIQHEIDQTTAEKNVILPHESLKSFLPLKSEALFENIHVTSQSVPAKCCFTKTELPMHSRPRIAVMHLSEDYRGPFDIQCLRRKTFPFRF